MAKPRKETGVLSANKVPRTFSLLIPGAGFPVTITAKTPVVLFLGQDSDDNDF